MTLVLFTTVAPHPLTEELSRQGYQVYEAMAVSEVFSLVELHPTASIIINTIHETALYLFGIPYVFECRFDWDRAEEEGPIWALT